MEGSVVDWAGALAIAPLDGTDIAEEDRASKSCRQFDDAGQEFGGVSAQADMDLKLPRLQDWFETWTDELQIVRGEPPGHLSAFARRKDDLTNALQLQQRTGDAGYDVANEQEERRLAFNVAIVGDIDGCLDAFSRLE
jgi:hypothetical protein